MKARVRSFLAAALLAAAAPAQDHRHAQGPPAQGERPTFSERELQRILRLSPLPPVPPDPTNAVADDPAAAHLGQYLFFDARLSADGSVSCATCHVPGRGFTDDKPVAEALGRATRRTPSLLGVAYQRWFFWDGRADSLWSQALAPIENPVEMGSSRVRVAQHLAADPELARAYADVFGALPDVDDREAVDRAFSNVGKAIAAYERKLVRERSPFDRFVEGLRAGNEGKKAALDFAAQRGLALFVGRGGCTLCHSGPNFSDSEFHNTAVAPREGVDPDDAGRYAGIAQLLQSPFNAAGAFSDDPDGAAARRLALLRTSSETWGEFKTPSLRNVALRAPYMHAGQLASLADVVDFYSTLEGALQRGHHQEQILAPLRLSPQEARDLLAFLDSLTGQPLPAELLVPPESPILGAREAPDGGR